MSELFLRRSPEETLGHIRERLGQHTAPAAIIEEMLPQTRDGALSWGRHLAVWDDYQREYPAQVVALARIISQRAMREHGLTLRKDGRVVERPAEGKGWKTPRPAVTFTLTVGGEELRIDYTPEYFPNSGTGLLTFLSPHEPPQPHALSETGCLARFVSPDLVTACGGPQAYAAQLAEALLGGREKEFTEALEGKAAEKAQPLRRRANPSAVEPGQHANRLSTEEKPQGPPRQGMLF